MRTFLDVAVAMLVAFWLGYMASGSYWAAVLAAFFMMAIGAVRRNLSEENAQLRAIIEARLPRSR